MGKARLRAATALAALCMVLLPLALVPTTAWAAGGYPPTTTTTTIGPTSGNGGTTINIGGQFTFQICGFLPGSPASYAWNGVHVGILIVDANGCLTFTITVYDPHVRINGGALLPANWNGNTLTVTGTGANTAPRTYTYTVNIVQPVPGGTGSTTGPPSSLAFTGLDADLLVGIALALITAGALLVVGSRRTRRRRSRRYRTS